MGTILRVCLVIGASAGLAACGSSGAGGREVSITQAEDGCRPASIEAAAGEKLNLVVKNETGDIYEIEGIEGAKLEEVIVPEGRTRSIGYEVPESGGVTKLKCYVPGGPATIIEVRAGEASADSPSGSEGGTGTPGVAADTTVTVTLAEYSVNPDAAAVPSGSVKFIAENAGKEVHELYVLKLRDGGYDVVGEIEDVGPGETGAMVLEMPPGEYRLACLIVPGEAGSAVDHFKEGMHTDFKVK